MRLTDTHCHLNLNTFQDDLQSVLERSRAAGVERILVPGIDLETSRRAVELAAAHPMIYAAVGVHPSEASTFDDEALSELRRLAHMPRVVAVGEIGLDYYRDRAPRPLQRAVFAAQLELAGEIGLPVVIHNRDAFEDVLAALSDWIAASPKNRRGVMHSFDGTLEEAARAVDVGMFIGISGPVTFKNAHEKHRVAAGLPTEVLLIETDAPYLTPHPRRGERNEPAFTAFIARKLAELRGSDEDDIAGVTAANAARLFNWEP